MSSISGVEGLPPSPVGRPEQPPSEPSVEAQHYNPDQTVGAARVLLDQARAELTVLTPVLETSTLPGVKDLPGYLTNIQTGIDSFDTVPEGEQRAVVAGRLLKQAESLLRVVQNIKRLEEHKKAAQTILAGDTAIEAAPVLPVQPMAEVASPAPAAAAEPMPVVSQPVPVPTPNSLTPVELEKRNRVIDQYRRLVRERQLVQEELANTSSIRFLKRNGLQARLAVLTRDIRNHQTTYSFLGTLPARLDLGSQAGRTIEKDVLITKTMSPAKTDVFDQPTQAKKYLANVRADIVQELQVKTAHQPRREAPPRNPNTEYDHWLAQFRAHLTNKPRFFGVAAWEQRKTDIEKELEFWRLAKRRQAAESATTATSSTATQV